MLSIKRLAATLVCTLTFVASAQTTQAVVDIPVRPGVTQRMIVRTGQHWLGELGQGRQPHLRFLRTAREGGQVAQEGEHIVANGHG